MLVGSRTPCSPSHLHSSIHGGKQIQCFFKATHERADSCQGLYSLKFLDTAHGCSDILINEEIEANRASELSKIITDMDLILKLNSFAAYHCPFSDYKDEQSV